MDRSFYAETQLTDTEIAEREAVRLAAAVRETSKERERHQRMYEFRWHGGIL